MKYINLGVLVCLCVTAFGQEVQFDYDRSAKFDGYKTYQWVDYRAVQVGDQLVDQDIKRAVDGQLASRGLRRVESAPIFSPGIRQRSRWRSSLIASGGEGRMHGALGATPA